MTRTARAESPQALLKDRSIARNGRDKSLKKGGAHGWGSIKDETELQLEAEDDEQAELQEAQDDEAPKRARRGSTLGEVKVAIKNNGSTA